MAGAYYNEFDPGAAAWLRELIRRGLIADGEVDERSILDVRPLDLAGFTQCHFFAGIGGWSFALRLAGWPDDRPVWTGSPPCQPFSAAGRRIGRDDARHLAPHFVGLVRACRPDLLFGEQVASADVFGGAAKRSGTCADAQPQWAWLDDLSDRLEAARYAVGAVDLPAAGVGAPHIRQRTFFGAVRLADADNTGPQGRGGMPKRANERAAWAGGVEGGLEHAARDGRGEWRAGTDGRGVAAGCGAGGLADAECSERGPISVFGLRKADGAQGGGAAAEFAGDRDGRGLADAYGGDASAEGLQRQRVNRFQPQDGSSGLGASAPTGEQDYTDDCGRPGAPDSPWRDADWLYCRDGKWRPVEPGTFPLAHGLPARVGRLRGYGNAIVPQAAAQFIRAFVSAAAI